MKRITREDLDASGRWWADSTGRILALYFIVEFLGCGLRPITARGTRAYEAWRLRTKALKSS